MSPTNQTLLEAETRKAIDEKQKAAREPNVVTTQNKHELKEEKFYLRTGNSIQELGMSEASDYIRTRFGSE